MKTKNEILDLIPVEKQGIAKDLLTEIAFLQKTLATLRKEIEAGGVLQRFENGKQNFTREAPALKGYNATVARYSGLTKQLLDLVPRDMSKQAGSALYEFIEGD